MPPDAVPPNTAPPDTAPPDVAAPDQAAAEDTDPGDEAALGDTDPGDAIPGDADLDETAPGDADLDETAPGRRAPVSKLAIVALFAVIAWIIVAGAVGTVAVLTHGFKKPVTIKYHEASVFKVRQGDCINTPNGQAVSVLPCATPHDAEVFSTFTLPGSAWPGTAAVQQEASSGCVTRLSGYLNPQLSISLAQTYVFPDKMAWNAGTRTVVCEVHATSGRLTSSVRGGS